MIAICIVRENLRVQGATAAQCDELITCAQVTAPAYVRAVRAGTLPWRRPAEFLNFARREGDDVVLSRGLTDLVRRVVPGVRFVDERQSCPFDFAPLRRELRPEQGPAVAAIARHQQGGICGPCGSGKSTIILGAVVACGERAIIAVPSLPILGQFERDVVDLMGITPGVVADGKKSFGLVTLITFAALRDLELRAALYRTAGALFVDECHGITGDETRALVDEFPGRVRVLLTATWPTDERNAILHALAGRILHRIETPALVGAGRLVRPTYRQVATTFTGEGNDFAALVEGTTHDEDRNALIVRTIAEHCGPGALGLALFGRVEHAERMASVLTGAGLRAEALTGAVRKSERERILTAARAGELDVLCATSLADEGLDVTTIARVFLIAPQKAGGRFVQRIGRSMRPHPGKPTPLVLDFADVRCGLLAHQARGRARAFEAIWQADARAA